MNRSSDKNPVDASSGFQERVRCRGQLLIRKGILKLSLAERSHHRPPRDIEIEVAGQYNGRIQVVLPGIFQGLVNLRATQRVIALAFQV